MAEAKTGKGAGAQETVTVDAFADLLKKEFRPKSDRAKQQIESAVQTLAQQVLSDQDLILDDAVLGLLDTGTLGGLGLDDPDSVLVLDTSLLDTGLLGH